jgi:glutathione S-transferase
LEVSPPLKAIHALGQAPVIRDGDTILAESARSSLTSSTATEEAGLPRNPKRGLRALPYWLHFAKGSLTPLDRSRRSSDLTSCYAQFTVAVID